MQTLKLWLLLLSISSVTTMKMFLCSSYANRARILISPHAADTLDIVISKSLDPERNLAAAAGLSSPPGL